jgi:hypothetical protein
MLRLSIIFSLLLLLTGETHDTLAKSWRQITPLRSTAEDVKKLAESCKETETRCQFTFEDQEVMIIFSGSNVGVLECASVPKGTVLAVIVKFSRPRRLRDFQLKNKKFKVFDPSHPPEMGYKTYYYENDGFLINSYKDQVIGLVYIAAKKDVHLCPEYYKDPKGFVEVGLVP